MFISLSFLEQNAPKAVVAPCVTFLNPPMPPSNRTYSSELHYKHYVSQRCSLMKNGRTGYDALQFD